MNLGSFLIMRQEAGLLLVFLIMLVLDIFASEKSKIRNTFQPLVCILFFIHTSLGFLFPSQGGIRRNVRNINPHYLDETYS